MPPSIPRSSNGRTAASGAAYLGSNPSLGANEILTYARGFFVLRESGYPLDTCANSWNGV